MDDVDEQVFRSDLRYLVNLARALTNRRQDSEDLAQATYVRAAPHLKDDMPSRRGYLRATMVNLLNDQSRRLRIVKEIPAESPGEPTATRDLYAEVDGRLDVARALDRLTPVQRQVLVLRYLEDMSTRDIARVMNRPVGTVRRLSAEALRNMQGIYASATEAVLNEIPLIEEIQES